MSQSNVQGLWPSSWLTTFVAIGSGLIIRTIFNAHPHRYFTNPITSTNIISQNRKFLSFEEHLAVIKKLKILPLGNCKVDQIIAQVDTNTKAIHGNFLA